MPTTVRSATRLLRPKTTTLELFEALDDTHRRTAQHLKALRSLVDRLDAAEVDDAVRSSALEIVTFFEGTARQHHQVEERDVFPPLLRSGNPQLAEKVERLRQDHGWLEEDWLELSPQLQAVAHGHCGYELESLPQAVEVFEALYLEHMLLEETLIYPAARRRLAAEGG